MRLEKFINICGVVTILLIIISIISTMIPIILYFSTGIEAMGIINFSVVISIITIFLTLFYLGTIAYDRITEWINERKEDDKI